MQSTYRYETGAITDKVYGQGRAGSGAVVVVYGWNVRSATSQAIIFESGTGFELWRVTLTTNGQSDVDVIYNPQGFPVPRLRARPGEDLTVTAAAAASVGIVWGVEE